MRSFFSIVRLVLLVLINTWRWYSGVFAVLRLNDGLITPIAPVSRGLRTVRDMVNSVIGSLPYVYKKASTIGDIPARLPWSESTVCLILDSIFIIYIDIHIYNDSPTTSANRVYRATWSPATSASPCKMILVWRYSLWYYTKIDECIHCMLNINPYSGYR